MNFLKIRRQNGSTLLVSMIMLIVLTLLVVFAIRSGNTNLRIAGNMQVQAEASAATQQAIEQVIEQIKVTEDLSLIPQQSVAVSVGAVTYTVTVSPMDKCVFDLPLLPDKLNPENPSDQPCIQTVDGDAQFNASGAAIAKPSACKTQQWDIEAKVDDSATGAKVTHVQGISVRVPATVKCL